MPDQERMIVGIGYKMHSGKDTLANILARDHGFVAYHFANKVKEVAQVMFGYTWKQMNSAEDKASFDPVAGMTIREVLQKVGNGMREALGHDVWIKSLFAEIDRSNETKIVIPDVRYLNELQEVTRRGIACQIVRSRELRGFAGPETDAERHVSETELDVVPERVWSVIIHNDGPISKLEDAAARIISLYPELHSGMQYHMNPETTPDKELLDASPSDE
jgi:hypothetical protein